MKHVHLNECHCGWIFFLEPSTTNIYKRFNMICLLSENIVLIPASMENIRLVVR